MGVHRVVPLTNNIIQDSVGECAELVEYARQYQASRHHARRAHTAADFSPVNTAAAAGHASPPAVNGGGGSTPTTANGYHGSASVNNNNGEGRNSRRNHGQDQQQQKQQDQQDVWARKQGKDKCSEVR